MTQAHEERKAPPEARRQTSAPGSVTGVQRSALRGMSFADGERALQFKDAPAAAGAPTSPAAPTPPAAPVASTALAAFRAELDKPKVDEAAAMAAWDQVDPKYDADEAIVLRAIEKLGAASANRVRVESNEAFGSKRIVDAIIARIGKWKSVLLAHTEDIATCDDGEPAAALRKHVQTWVKGYTPKLADDFGGKVAAVGKPFTLRIEDAGWTDAELKRTPPRFEWTTKLDAKVFGKPYPWPDGKPERSPVVTYTLTPTQVGRTPVEVDLAVFDDKGFIGKSRRTYEVQVIDGNDPEALFEAKFGAEFAAVLKTTAFEDVVGKPGAIAKLFNPKQREQLSDFCDTKKVPVGLFTFHPKNESTGPQRIMISTHILTQGKLATGDAKSDGNAFVADSCGGWAQGVRTYAAAGAAGDYGANNSQQAISPTGEKSYSSGAHKTLSPQSYRPIHADQNQRLRAVRSEIPQTRALLKIKLEDRPGKVSDEELNAKLEKLEAELKAFEDAHERNNATRSGSGHHSLKANELKKIRAGDWLTIDNGGADGHSFFFSHWGAGDKPEQHTLEEGSFTAHGYQQTGPGGSVGRTVQVLGFPPRAKSVSGVTSIGRMNDAAQIASTTTDFLAIDVAKFVLKNKKLLEGLDLTKVKARIDALVRPLAEGIQGKTRRHDKEGHGRLTGDFTPPQKKVVAEILAGTGDDERDIVLLIALGQKLSFITQTSGSGAPGGYLEDPDNKRFAGTNGIPIRAWKRDPTMQRDTAQ